MSRFPVAWMVARRSVPRSLACGFLFGLAVVSSVEQFTNVYDTAGARREIASIMTGNGALRALFGAGRELQTVPGWVAWRSLGILTILGPIWGLLLATRLFRGEEDSGRWDIVVSGPTTARRATGEAMAGLGLGLVALWATTAAMTCAAGRMTDPAIPVRAALFLSVALVAPAGLFLAFGALSSQLASTRRQASKLAAAAFGLAFLVRALGNSDGSLGWITWLTPLGWPQRLRPLTGSSAGPLVLLVVLAAILSVSAILLAGARDVGAGLVRPREAAPDRARAPRSLLGLTVHLERGHWLGWAAGLGVMAAFFGMIAAAAADTSSDTLDSVLTRLGAEHTGAKAYLGAFFLMLAAALAVVAAGQVTETRDEETLGHAQALLVRPVSRSSWLSGRVLVSGAGLFALSLVIGICAWAGAATQDTSVSLGAAIAASGNTLPAALVVLGLGTLVQGLAPRWTAAAVYGVVGWSFAVQLLGAAGGGGGAVSNLSIFQPLSLMPAAPFQPGGALTLLALGAGTATAGVLAFTRRDMVGA
jgi:ABC-2 type transport system permease protein